MSILDVELFEEPKDDFLKKELQRQRLVAQQRRAACALALPAMARLAEILKHRSGQPYKLRALLYSLWNGKPTSLVELVCFDWQIRQDLLLVLAAFGYEDSKVGFFYRAIEEAVQKAGQWAWFLEERFQIEPMVEYLKSVERDPEFQKWKEGK